MKNPCKKIAIIFDFDDTLCNDSTEAFLKYAGIDTEEFWHLTSDKIKAGFDPALAYMTLMIDKASETKSTAFFTKKNMQNFGKTLKFYPGVKVFFNNIRKYVKSINSQVKLEFYLISSGLEGIIINSAIADEFSGIYASAFDYEKRTGKIIMPKRVVSFTDKTRFLFAISKGIKPKEYFSNPFKVNERQSPSTSYNIPISQMIYVGDGFTDIPCFSVVKAFHGKCIGVYKKNRHHIAKSLIKDNRVFAIADVNYNNKGQLVGFIKKYIYEIIENLKNLKK
ncbi:MAG: hypothetical protein ACD_79C00300G0001 [uncultured bacterium]|nr:MAG: hypothetical protein ACD_79C00300G0001 [uncultured bacterium]